MSILHRWIKMYLVIVLLVFAGASCKQSVQAAREANSSPSKDVLLTPADRTFMRTAEDNDIKSRNLAREVMQRSQNSDIRDYAKMINEDHTRDLHKAVDLMESKGIHQSKDMPEIKHEALAKLSRLNGAALDREYIATVIKDHERDIAEYRRETQKGEDPTVRDYAARELETLQKHLAKAQDLEGKLQQSSMK